MIVGTRLLIEFVTNRVRYPDAPKYLPEYILLKNRTILVLKRKQNIVMYSNACSLLTNVILCEPWRDDTDFDNFDLASAEFENSIMWRKRQVLPFSAAKFPEI